MECAELVKGWESRLENNKPGKHENFAITWFENRLDEAKSELEKLYADFRLSEALKSIYSLVWDDFCSWYLEWIKPGFEQKIEQKVYEETVYFFEELMQLLHPFMPFITEEVFHQLKKRDDGEDLTIKQFSAPKAEEPAVLEQGKLLKEIITGLRDARNKNNIKPKETIRLYRSNRK